MITEFIENYKELGVAGIAILTFAWYLYHQNLWDIIFKEIDYVFCKR